LKYDLDSIFIWSRRDYLRKILKYEEKGKVVIKDLDDMKIKLNN